jgi:hypothetical protein
MLQNLIGRRNLAASLAFAAGIGCLTAVSSAQLSITDGSSTAMFNLPGIAGGTVAGQPTGMYYLDRNNPGASSDWLQDVSNSASQVGTVASAGNGQWWFIGINGAPAESIDKLGNGSVSQTVNALNVTYGTNVLVSVASQLSGFPQGAYKDSMTHQIQIINNNATPVSIKLYGYSNFDLTQIHVSGSGSPGTFLPAPTNYNTAVVSGNTISQVTHLANGVYTSGMNLTFSGGSGTFVGIQADDAHTTSPSLFQQLSSGTFTGNLTPTANGSGVTGTNVNQDPEFAYQYNVVIPAGQSQTINDMFEITPEPASLMLLLAGGLLVGARPRRHA